MSKIHKNAHVYYTHVSEVNLYFDARISNGQVEVWKGDEFVPRPDLILVRTPGSDGVYTWRKDLPLDQNGFKREVVKL